MNYIHISVYPCLTYLLAQINTQVNNIKTFRCLFLMFILLRLTFISPYFALTITSIKEGGRVERNKAASENGIK